MLFLPLGLFYKTMGLLDEVNYNNNNSYNLSTIILVVGWLLEDGARRPPSYFLDTLFGRWRTGREKRRYTKKAPLVWWTYNFSSYPIISNALWWTAER